MTDEEATGKSAQMAYLDLLTSVLTQHEKTLDSIIGRLEKASGNLMKTLLQAKERGETPPSTTDKREVRETITYMKIDINRPVDELTKILESLTAKPTGVSTIIRVPPLRSEDKKIKESET